MEYQGNKFQGLLEYEEAKKYPQKLELPSTLYSEYAFEYYDDVAVYFYHAVAESKNDVVKTNNKPYQTVPKIYWM